MPFTDTPIETGSSEPKNKVYVKWIQPGINKSNPFFEVNMADWTKSEHKTMKDMTFVSAERHVYTTEEWGDKQQMHIILKDWDGTQYDLYANWNSITRAMYNSIAWANEIDKISIVFNYNWAWEFLWTQVYLNGWDKPVQWAFSWDDYHSKVKTVTVWWKEIKEYTDLDEAITLKLEWINKWASLIEELEAAEKEVKKPAKKKEEESDLPF